MARSLCGIALIALIFQEISWIRPAESASSISQLAELSSGIIAGSVTDARTRQPVAEAIVYVATLDKALDGVRTTLTDFAGRYEFRGLQPSSYLLAAAKIGYLPLDFADGARVEVQRGRTVIDVNLTMWRPGYIAGRVVDEAGEAVVSVPVRVLRRIQVAGLWHLAAGPISKTDDRGFYRIADLAPGDYIVALPSVQVTIPMGFSDAADPVGSKQTSTVGRVGNGPNQVLIGNYPIPPLASDGAWRVYRTTFHSNSQSVESATPIHLERGGQKDDVDFTIQPTQAFRVFGRIAAAPNALIGSVIRLVPIGSEDLGVGSEQATSLIGPGGTFEFVAVPSGSYSIVAGGPVQEFITSGAGIAIGLPPIPGMRNRLSTGRTVRSAPSDVLLAIRDSDADGSYWIRERMDVENGDVNIVVVANRAATLSGRVLIDGPVVGHPRLWVEPASGAPSKAVATPPALVETPDRGFSVRGLRDGPYLLRVDGGPELSLKSVTVDGVDCTEKPFTVIPGIDVSNVLVTLTSLVTTLAGTVEGANGRPESAGSVLIFPVDQAKWTSFGFDPLGIRTVTPDPQGSYEIRGLPSGEYYVIATRSSGWRDPQFLAAAQPLATRVTLRWGARTVQSLSVQQVRGR